MNNSPQLGLTPLNNCVLIELQQPHKNFTTKDVKYQAYTEGIVVPTEGIGLKGYDVEDIINLINKRVFFEEYKEGGHITRNGKKYAFVRIEDIRGYEDVEIS